MLCIKDEKKELIQVIFHRATWGAVGHGALYHSQVALNNIPGILYKGAFGKWMAFFIVIFLCRALSPTLHTPLVSRLPSPVALQRPRACSSPVLGICDWFCPNKNFIPIYLRDQNPCIFFEPKILYRFVLTISIFPQDLYKCVFFH